MTKYTLTIYVDDEELYDKYSEAAKKQDENIKKEFPDSGFDMYVPETIISKPQQIVKVVSNVVCDMRKKGKPSGFYVYPRSSISKTPLRLANQVGIIDSGYRGPLIGVLIILVVVLNVFLIIKINALFMKIIHIELKNIQDFFKFVVLI